MMSKNASNSDNLDSISINSSSTTENDHNHHLFIESNSSTNGHLTENNNNFKYEKLVQEYVKLRSKLTVLKKAYIDLSDSSAQKDQSIRKYEQEIEGLTFRNQQLTARVELLQNDLDASKNSVPSAPSKHDSSNKKVNTNLPSPSSLSSNNSAILNNNNSNTRFEILAEELQHKINENTHLHRKLSEMEVEFGQKLAKNELLLKKLEYDKIILDKKLESTENSSKNLIEKLQNDKIKLELNLIQLENQLRETHHEKEKQEIELKKENQELKTQNQQYLHSNSSSSLSSLGASSTPIKSAANNALINLQTPTKEDVFIGHLNCHIEILSKLFESLEERSCLFSTKSGSKSSSSLSKHAVKCDKILNQQLVPLLKSSFSSKMKSDIDRILSEFFDFFQLLLQSISNDLINANDFIYANRNDDETLKIINQNDEMETLNKKLKIYVSKIDALLFNNNGENNFSSIIIHLISNSHSNLLNIPNLSTKFLQFLSQLNDILDKMLFVFNEKLALEYTLDYPSELTTTDECILSYLTQFKQTNILMQSLLNTSNVSIIDIISKLVSKFKQTENIDEQQQTIHESVRINENIKEIQDLRENVLKKDNELNDIKQKHDELKQKWQNDFDNMERLNFRFEQLQIKYQELKQREEVQLIELNELKKSSMNLEGSQIKSKDISITKLNDSIKASISDDFNNMNCFNQFDLENATIGQYVKQIEDLNQKLEMIEGKSRYYYDEMKSMFERLTLQVDQNKLLEGDLCEIKDQLERTRLGYETQMSTMTDHLIEMTERMTKQLEENEKLKHELNMSTNGENNNSKNSKSSGGGLLSKSNHKKSAK